MSQLAMIALLVVAGQATDPEERGDELAVPVRVEAAGVPIDTEVGHAHPLVADWDGDGDRDLLVGQFGGGLLWIFENEAPVGGPRLVAGRTFKVGTDDGRVPTG